MNLQTFFIAWNVLGREDMMYKYSIKGFQEYGEINLDVVYYKAIYLHYDIRDIPDTIASDFDQFSRLGRITSIEEVEEVEEGCPKLLDITFYADRKMSKELNRDVIMAGLGVSLFDDE